MVVVVVDAVQAGKSGYPALGTNASTFQMLKLGSVCCVAMLVLGIIASPAANTGTRPSSRPSSAASRSRSPMRRTGFYVPG
jgi:hypothetical protein